MIKKSYVITGFDCANCAQKSERHLNNNKKIKEAIIDFSNDRLHITFADEELSIKEILNIIKEVEDDPIEITKIGDNKKRKIFNKENIIKICRIIFAVICLSISLTILNAEQYFWFSFSIYALALIVISYDVYWKVIKHIVAKENPVDEYLLMSLTSIGAFTVATISKENHIFMESLMVMILFQVGEIIEGIATSKSKEAITSAVSLRIESANRINNDKIEAVLPDELNVKDQVIVAAGEQIPVDGVIVSGQAEIDTSSLTGEFIPISSKKELEVFAGYIVKSGSVIIEVTRTYKDSAVSKVNELISNSGSKKSRADEFVTKFARIYTPIIFAVSILVMLLGGIITNEWQQWILLGLKMLVVGCPCAIVISVPLAYFSAIGLASKNGIVIKGSNYLDRLVNLKKVVTDKTGTLTEGTFVISKKTPKNISEDELIEYLVAAEYLSTHPIGLAICKGYDTSNLINLTSDYKEVAGCGVSVNYKNKHIIAGNAKMLRNNNVNFTETDEIGSVVYLSVDNQYCGYVVLNDVVKKDAKEMVSLLKKENIETIVLTGDKEENAKKICDELGISKYHSGLLPDEKASHLEKELSKNYVTAFVGDGINDAASIREADVGFAMGAIGSDVAVENADVVIMNDKPSKIYDAYKIAKIARRVSLFNIVFSLGIKIGIELAAFITSLFGRADIIPMWLAVIADTGLTVLLVINSLLILYRKINHKSV